MLASPVPTQTVVGLDGATSTSPIDIIASTRSKTGVHVVPWFVLLKRPPLAVATYNASGAPAYATTSYGFAMYGAYWCPHCADQKEMFRSSFQYVPYVECGVPGSRDEAPVCKDAGVKHFPTWQFGDGERREGTQTLQALQSKTGCALP